MIVVPDSRLDTREEIMCRINCIYSQIENIPTCSNITEKLKKRFIKNFGISEYLSNVIISEILSEDPNTDKRRYKQIRSFDKEKHYEKANRDHS